jgi:hypothetical protein
MNTTIITADLVPEARRLRIAATLFGVHFPLQLEPMSAAFRKSVNAGSLKVVDFLRRSSSTAFI